VWGGSGALSLRNRTIVLAVLEDHITAKATADERLRSRDEGRRRRRRRRPDEDAAKDLTAPPASEGGDGGATERGEGVVYAEFKGNEDMWFIRRLVELRDAALLGSLHAANAYTFTDEAGITRNITSTSSVGNGGNGNNVNNGNAGSSGSSSSQGQRVSRHGVGLVVGGVDIASVRLAPRDASLRWAAEVLAACPEAKRLFEARHERGDRKAGARPVVLAR